MASKKATNQQAQLRLNGNVTLSTLLFTIQASMQQRIVNNRPLLKSFALFASCRFPDLLTVYKTARVLQGDVTAFCAVYQL